MTTKTPLTLQEQRALADALDDEYKSHETYHGVIRDFGPVRPFINILEAEAEARHISALGHSRSVPGTAFGVAGPSPAGFPALRAAWLTQALPNPA